MPRLVALTLVLVVLGWSRAADAYPWMIRHGYTGCVTCHADPSGGELLTLYGRAQGDLVLRMRYGKEQVAAPPGGSGFDSFDEPSAKPASGRAPERESAAEAEGAQPTTGFLWGLWDTPSWLLLGGSLRNVLLVKSGSVRSFPMQADLYGQVSFGALRAGGSIGAARLRAGSLHGRAAQVTTNQGDGWNLVSRTHWVGLALGDADSLVVRAGRLNLPFGVRLSEHVMWVREATRTDRESDQEHGLAVAFTGSPVRGELMAIAGNYQISPDRYRERGYSGYAEWAVTDGLALGLSSLVTVARADSVSFEQERTLRGAHGPLLRARLAKPLALLAEADVMHTSRRDFGYTSLAQLDLELVQGLHLLGTGEALDQGMSRAESNRRVPGEGKPRFRGWLSADWFFFQQLDVRADFVVPQDGPAWLMAQLHAYL